MILPAKSTDLAVQEAINDLQGESLRYAGASKALNTRKSYASDWVRFSQWIADAYGVDIPEPDENYRVALEDPIHPAFVIRFVTDMATKRKSVTLNRYVAAIRHHHRTNGLVSPTDHPQVRQVLSGIQNEHRYRTKQAKPLYLAELNAVVRQFDGGSLREHRNRALLLLGWWGAFRASELVGLAVADVGYHPEGMIVTLGKSKTDQAGEGRDVAIHYRADDCPVLAVRSWLQVSGIQEGPLFQPVPGRGYKLRPGPMSRKEVGRIVKKVVETIGLDPSGYSAHSLRAGFVSECDRRHVPAGAVRAVTGHKSDQMLNYYSRPAQIFRDSAGAWFD